MADSGHPVHRNRADLYVAWIHSGERARHGTFVSFYDRGAPFPKTGRTIFERHLVFGDAVSSELRMRLFAHADCVTRILYVCYRLRQAAGVSLSAYDWGGGTERCPFTVRPARPRGQDRQLRATRCLHNFALLYS